MLKRDVCMLTIITVCIFIMHCILLYDLLKLYKFKEQPLPKDFLILYHMYSHIVKKIIYEFIVLFIVNIIYGGLMCILLNTNE